MQEVEFYVGGQARPKGSGTIVTTKAGKRRYVESADMQHKGRASGALQSWEQAIGWAARLYCRSKFRGPVAVRMHFYLERPKTVTREYPCVPPDLSKLQRAVEDALNDIAFVDDGQVIEAWTRKDYVEPGHTPGVRITVRSA